MQDASDEEWIGAAEAAQSLSRKFGGVSVAQHAIASGLREGLIRAAAQSIAVAEGVGSEFIEEKAPSGGLLELEERVWRLSVHWDADRLSWDWQDGFFEVEGAQLEDIYMFFDVHFLRSDIDAIEPSEHPYANVIQRTAGEVRDGGRTTAARYWDWDPAFADLVALADLDGLEEHFGPLRRGFQAKLERWFADQMSDDDRDPPSENERRIRARRVRLAIERLRASRVSS